VLVFRSGGCGIDPQVTLAQKNFFSKKNSNRRPEISIGKYNQFIARISQFFGHSQINTPNWLIYARNWLYLPIFILSVEVILMFIHCTNVLEVY
jgi:hypothetical protein